MKYLACIAILTRQLSFQHFIDFINSKYVINRRTVTRISVCNITFFLTSLKIRNRLTLLNFLLSDSCVIYIIIVLCHVSGAE
jgi:hypothetical protein